MKTRKRLTQLFACLSITSLSALLLAGCQSASEKPSSGSSSMSTSAPATASTSATTSTPAAASATTSAEPKVALPIRIKAGGDGFTDSSGNVWQADHGFADGDTVPRPDLSITNASDPRIYLSERYSMTKFTQPLPNGKYIVKLHFCETFEGIEGPGGRVFSFNVAGHEFKDFDVWVKAHGPQRAYVETVPVNITNGMLEITFTPNVENPQINGLEILPGT
jgi:hypothetical protein